MFFLCLLRRFNERQMLFYPQGCQLQLRINFKMENESSDSDIITETPPKPTQKLKKLPKPRPRPNKTSHRYEEYLPDQKCIADVNHNLEMTRVGSTDQNKPYVYRTIDELLEINENCLPKNNNMHLLGVHKFSPSFGHYLTNKVAEEGGSCFVQLDFNFVANVPDQGVFMSVYGSLENKAECHKRVIFVVRFYREEAASMVIKYKENLKFLRNYIPTRYLATISSNQW